VKAAVDLNDILHWWNRPAGFNGGYCSWWGITCVWGTSRTDRGSVYSINLSYTRIDYTKFPTLTPLQKAMRDDNATFKGMQQLPSPLNSIFGKSPLGDSIFNHKSLLPDMELQGLTGTLPPAAAFVGLGGLKMVNITRQLCRLASRGRCPQTCHA
jgi:hypothetical protein